MRLCHQARRPLSLLELSCLARLPVESSQSDAPAQTLLFDPPEGEPCGPSALAWATGLPLAALIERWPALEGGPEAASATLIRCLADLLAPSANLTVEAVVGESTYLLGPAQGPRTLHLEDGHWTVRERGGSGPQPAYSQVQRLAAKEANPDVRKLLEETAAALQRQAAQQGRGKGPVRVLTPTLLLELPDARQCPRLGEAALQDGEFLTWLRKFRVTPELRYQAVVNTYTYLQSCRLPPVLRPILVRCLTTSAQHDVWQAYRTLTAQLKTCDSCPRYCSQLLYLDALRGRALEPVDFEADLAKRNRCRGPSCEAVSAALGLPLAEWIYRRLRQGLAGPVCTWAESWRNRYGLVASGSGRAARDPEFSRAALPVPATEPKNWAAAKLAGPADLLARLEPEVVITPVKKQNELGKLRAIYPVPLYTSILEAVAWG